MRNTKDTTPCESDIYGSKGLLKEYFVYIKRSFICNRKMNSGYLLLGYRTHDTLPKIRPGKVLSTSIISEKILRGQ